jgi:hypothetical protein
VTPEGTAAHLSDDEAHVGALIAEVVSLRDDNTSLRGELVRTQGALATLRARYHQLVEELHLLKRRLNVAKAERLDDVADAQLAFDKLLVETEAIQKALEVAGGSNEAMETTSSEDDTSSDPKMPKKRRRRGPPPTGRRRLDAIDESTLPVVRIEISDPNLEGKAPRIGVEETSCVGYERGGFRRLVKLRIVYKESVKVETETEVAPSTTTPTPAAPEASDVTPSVAASDASEVAIATNASADTPVIPARDASASVDDVVTAPAAAAKCAAPITSKCHESAKAEPFVEAKGRPAAPAKEEEFRIVKARMPKEIVPRGILAPSAIAHILAMKYVLGVPFYRQEKQCALEGFALDRGTMCRYAEHVGATLGCIVEAAREEAIATAVCLSTDATGHAIQPTRLEDGKRQVCRKGHFFVTLADKDHVFLDFQPKHTSLTVWNMFKGFSGYVQADAHVIYDALFKGLPPEGADEKPGECGPPPIEVGCYSHVRRKYWEAAICRHPLGLHGVKLIDAIFAADRELANLAPAQRKVRRDASVRPLVDKFFDWARAEFAKVESRGLVATALGYSVRHEQALRRFLDDGRLRMDNNPAENALRVVALGRKVFLFYGSDDHASAAGNLLSLIASCKLHDLDPELYLAEIIRIVPQWPRDRYLELAPRYWSATRARLNPKELELHIGHITVPAALPKKQPASN